MKKYLLIGLAIFIYTIAFGFFIIYNFFVKPNNPNQNILPTPTPTNFLLPDVNPTYKQGFEQDLKNNQTLLEKYGAIANFTKKLPYTGTNFTLEYDINTTTYILILNKDNYQAGENEFQQYLKDNNVDESLMKISTKYK